MKRCSKCKKIKPLEKFNHNYKCKDTYNTVCKLCEQITKLKNYNRRKEEAKKNGITLASIKLYGFEKAVELYNKFGKKCSICNKKEKLIIHHKDNNGYRLMRKGLEMNNNDDNLIILCNSCHAKIHNKDRVIENRWSEKEKEIIKNGMINKINNKKILPLLNNRTLEALWRRHYLIRLEQKNTLSNSA